MPRKLPTVAERRLHRLQITVGDLIDAILFIDAAIKASTEGADPTRDPIHRALVCAAVIHYARPFSGNEHPNPKRRPKAAAETRVEIDSRFLRKVIPSASGRILHRQVIKLRNKIVAHAESGYFPVTMVRSEWAADPKLLAHDFGFTWFRPFPAVDLRTLNDNAQRLRNHLWFAAYGLSLSVRPLRRLRRAKNQ
jgi:hypothetical protein